MWEVNSGCRKAIMASELKPLHLFGDVCEKLLPDVVDRLAFIRKTLETRCRQECADAPKEVKLAARKAASERLLKVAKACCQMGKRERLAFFHIHKRLCPCDLQCP